MWRKAEKMRGGMFMMMAEGAWHMRGWVRRTNDVLCFIGLSLSHPEMYIILYISVLLDIRTWHPLQAMARGQRTCPWLMVGSWVHEKNMIQVSLNLLLCLPTP
jgi:hypothetical protein